MSTGNRRPITQEEIEDIEQGYPISQYMPLRDQQGGELLELNPHCRTCLAMVPDKHTRFRVHKWGNNYELRGWACCLKCHTATPFHLRFMPDGSLAGPHSDTGQWVRWSFLAESNRPWWDLVGRIQDFATHAISAIKRG